MEMEIELEIGNETKKKTENTMTEINGEMKGFKSKTDDNTSIDDAIDPSTSYTANITPAPRLLTDKGETETTGIVVGEKVDDEEGARRIIEMLRGADVSCRISAANKLEEVAAALGQTRTREVSKKSIYLLYFKDSIFVACVNAYHFSLKGVNSRGLLLSCDTNIDSAI